MAPEKRAEQGQDGSLHAGQCFIPHFLFGNARCSQRRPHQKRRAGAPDMKYETCVARGFLARA